MIRVCKAGHVTGTRQCWCGKDASAALGNRRQPDPMHPKSQQLVELRRVRALTGIGSAGANRLKYTGGTIQPDHGLSAMASIGGLSR